MNCDYCDYALETHEHITRQDGRRYCDVCIGRLGIELAPLMADWTDLQPAR